MSAAAGHSAIKINCDVGEGAPDACIIPHVDWANVACGGHAGNTQAMRTAVALAGKHGVRVGAHPGYPDKAHFGRILLNLPAAALYATLVEQLQCFKRQCGALGQPVHHVKPHGALYHEMTTKEAVFQTIIAAVKAVVPRAAVIVPCLPAVLHFQRHTKDIVLYREAFADRAYQSNGQLRSRKSEGSVLDTVDAIRSQLAMIESGIVVASDNKELTVTADTVCFHGDNAASVAFLSSLNPRLTI